MSGWTAIALFALVLIIARASYLLGVERAETHINRIVIDSALLRDALAGAGLKAVPIGPVEQEVITTRH